LKDTPEGYDKRSALSSSTTQAPTLSTLIVVLIILIMIVVADDQYPDCVCRSSTTFALAFAVRSIARDGIMRCSSAWTLTEIEISGSGGAGHRACPDR
jgi:hypothetical protein